jgi:hypothetical protein
MATEKSLLDLLIDCVSVELPPVEAPPESAPNLRALFLELVAVSLGNLYAKMPLPATLYDRSMLRPIATGLDDSDASKLTNRAEDWMRLEGLVRAAEGQKAYLLNRPAMAVLSTQTSLGTLGEVLERVTRSYADQKASPALREQTRKLATYFLTRIARS